ncbi:hypothetical protein [Fimbriiglobus ruber]|uniref:hypothetical protein n=1 Tax=Fimbriiglobus ruber TaxID=1908690 RepID=UPI00117AAC8A|nr:hypothetical protein [Fimbriiglobus ruber]
MGLDMYLQGEAFFTFEHPNRSLKPFPKQSEMYQLGYWRKHPNLHGFIVETFANAVDDCKEIELTASDLRRIVQAIKERQLPETTGFFFGKSDPTPEQTGEDIKIFEAAIVWLESQELAVWRSVSYRASW